MEDSEKYGNYPEGGVIPLAGGGEFPSFEKLFGEDPCAKVCGHCHYFIYDMTRRDMYGLKDCKEGACWRFPQWVEKYRTDYCGEFKLKEG